MLVAAGCSGGSSASSDDSGATSNSAAGESAVSITDLKYGPAEVSVAAGSSVTWTNNEDVPHTVSFDDDAVSDSEELAEGDTFSATFDAAGEYTYVCAIHPDMKGTVTVQ